MQINTAAHVNASLLTAFAESENLRDAEEILEQFEDYYAGTFDSVAAWAEDVLAGTGELDAIPSRLRFYFDYAAYVRDCELGGDIWTIETREGTAVFWNR